MDDVTIMLHQRLDRIEEKLDRLTSQGCAKAPDHDAHEGLSNRVRMVEAYQAEGKGRLSIFMLVVGAAVTALLQWLSRHW